SYCAPRLIPAVWMSRSGTPSALIRSITAVISRALLRIASTAVDAWVVTPALIVTRSGSASTDSVTVSSTTGPAEVTSTAAAAGVARNGTAISGRAIRCMGKPPIMRSRLHAPELRAAERFGSAALSGSCQRSARGRHARIPEHLPIALERGVRPARLRREVPGNAAVPASAPHQADAHIDRHLAPVDDDRL